MTDAKEQQRSELHRTIWAIANDLRGSVDGWDFKQYVLGTMFYRFISVLFARIVCVGRTEVNKVYDPACGSGSLLLKFAKILGPEHVRKGYFGQEVNLTTYNLCRINMFLHDVGFENFDIALGDTLRDPKHWDDELFDAIVEFPGAFQRRIPRGSAA
jgi:type I restriction-modification system DNA methylase subunit